MLLLLCCFVFLWDVKQTNTKNELARDVPERTWIETAQTANERLFERLTHLVQRGSESWIPRAKSMFYISGYNF